MDKCLIFGGMAHDDGVTFYGRTHQTTAKRLKDGQIEVKTKKIGKIPQWVFKAFEIPLIRGYADSLYALFMTWYLGIIFIIYPVAAILYSSVQHKGITVSEDMARGMEVGSIFGAAIGLTFAMIFIVLRGKLTAYHGAEHIAHNLYMNGKPLEYSSIKDNYRFHNCCGSSWILILLFYVFVCKYIPFNGFVKVLLWFPFYGEVMMNNHRIVKYLFLPIRYFSLLLQVVLTKVPEKLQMEVSLTAFKELLKVEEKICSSGVHATS